ncbi:MAG TPA: diadenylate cyclase CdaA [Clostridia bacterium]|nr:diadenylate cyclase CdaA [Clostridia bacterium]
MDFIINAFRSAISAVKLLSFRDIIDIVVLTLLFFQLLKITRETRANQVLKGVGIVLVGSLIASWIPLRGVSWILNYIINTGPLMLLVIFQPEIRRAFEQVGRGKIFDLPSNNEFDYISATNEIIRTVINLSKRQVGAFIVIKGRSGISDIIESGVYMDAAISSPLLENIFEPGAPLHDGAAIITNGKVTAAGCFSPTTMRTDLPQELGARHRAAIGISENSDATAIVVSEETGIISVAYNGKLTRNLDLRALKTAILEAYSRAGALQSTRGFKGIWIKGRKKNAEGEE